MDIGIGFYEVHFIGLVTAPPNAPNAVSALICAGIPLLGKTCPLRAISGDFFSLFFSLAAPPAMGHGEPKIQNQKGFN
jgi:hypothetical protein